MVCLYVCNTISSKRVPVPASQRFRNFEAVAPSVACFVQVGLASLPETYTKPDSSLSEILPIHCRFLLNDTHVACLDEGATHLVELRKFKSGPRFVVVRTGNYRFTLPHFPVIVDMIHKQFGRAKLTCELVLSLGQ